MSVDENSVAPIDRVVLKYKSKDQGGEEVEIPFKLLVVGDFSLREDSTPLADRKPVAINKDNFNEVMAAKNLELDLTVKDELSGVPDGQIRTKLKIKSLKDMTPDGIAKQVPEMKRKLELADELKDIKSALSDPARLRALREKLDKVLADEENKKKLAEMKKLQ
jgi:type VI secretion system protein ImpB